MLTIFYKKVDLREISPLGDESMKVQATLVEH